MTSRRSIGQEEASDQNMLESIPAPALSSADLVPPSFTCPTGKCGIPFAISFEAGHTTNTKHAVLLE